MNGTAPHRLQKYVATTVLLMLGACSATLGTEPKSQVLGVDDVYYASARARVLQSLNVRDTTSLQTEYEQRLAGDIKTMRHRLQTDSLVPYAERERAAAVRALALLAVMHENHPVAAWNGDPEVTSAFQWVIQQAPGLVAALRQRDWSKPLN